MTTPNKPVHKDLKLWIVLFTVVFSAGMSWNSVKGGLNNLTARFDDHLKHHEELIVKK